MMTMMMTLTSMKPNKKMKVRKELFSFLLCISSNEIHLFCSDTWNSLSTPQFKGAKDAYGTTSTTPKSTEPSSTPAAIDPYYTHFDPRSEHQSYKVQN